MNTKNSIKIVFLCFVLIANSSSHLLFSQDLTTKDTLYPIVQQLQSDVKLAKKLKISGYVQAQYQTADTAGIASMAGGDFDAGIDNRFKVRRGRMKVAYATGLSSAVLQFDMTEKGVKMNEVYLKLKEPLLNTITLTGGVFDRPFGYEIAYSSSKVESLERSRITQILFPGEKDLGGQLTIQAPKTSVLNFIKLEAGIFAGNGPAIETDSYQDFIGHLHMSKTSTNKKFSWGLGGSYYNGGFAAATDKLYSLKRVAGINTFVSDSVGKGSKLGREYIGFDGQLSIDWGLGMTQIRAEYLTGSQTGKSTSTSSLESAMSGDGYVRNFNGYYVYFIQDIGQLPFQAVVKYDVYDPNTDIAGNQIGIAATGTGDADVKYSTLGFGLHYLFDSNTRISAYYDMVTNETTNLLADGSTLIDLSKDKRDNVFTLRLQYKF